MFEQLTEAAQEAYDALNIDEQMFMNHYFSQNFNSTKAYLMTKPGVGYHGAASGGARIMKRKHVRHFLQTVGQLAYGDTVASLEECLEELTTIIRDPDVSRNERMKAVDMRLRTLGAYVDKLETTGAQNIVINVEGSE